MNGPLRFKQFLLAQTRLNIISRLVSQKTGAKTSKTTYQSQKEEIPKEKAGSTSQKQDFTFGIAEKTQYYPNDGR